MNFILKIVEGPNKGAEIALVEGVAVTLGKGDDCDIVLADPTMPAEPLKIEASETGVTVGGDAVEPLEVKTVGATSFAVGPADAPWGELKWPKPDAPDESGDEASDEKKDEDNAPSDVSSPASPAAPSAEAPVENKRRRGCLGCLVAAILLLLALAALAWFFRDDPRVAKVNGKMSDLYGKAIAGLSGLKRGSADGGGGADAAAVPVADLASIAAKYGLSFAESNGVAWVSGNLPTRRERLAATAEAYAAKPGVNLDLFDDESFRTAAEDALFTLTEGTLKVAAATNRVLTIAGTARSSAALERILRSLNADMPKLADVDVRGVKFAVKPVGKVEEYDETGDGREEASSPSNVSRLLLRRSRRKVQPAASTADLPVCGILTVPYPCLVLRDGKRVFEGASIGDNVILKIGADSVTVTNSTGRFEWKP